jgi:hypothetical protein
MATTPVKHFSRKAETVVVSYLVDAQVMTMSGTARERTSNEFASLLSESGFGLRRVVPTQLPVCVVEAFADPDVWPSLHAQIRA